MSNIMRCQYCGILQDEPTGAKLCAVCGGELAFEAGPPPDERGSYVQAQMELDQVQAPAGRNVERHLLVTLRTPLEIPASEMAATATGRPALGFTAVLDVSGSMNGEKLAQAKDAIRQALNRLKDGDTLALVTFSNEVRCVLEPTRVDDRIRRVVESALREISATGMTALAGGLELGIEKARASKQDPSLVLLLSDGQANVGETDIEKVGLRGLGARQQGLTVSTLGVGDDYNEALMAEVAAQGGGRFYHVRSASQIAAYLTGELGEMAALAAREAQLHLSIPSGTLLMPLSTAYPAAQDGAQATITIGDLPRDLELEIPIRAMLPAQSTGVKLSFDGALTYRSPAGSRLKTTLNRVTVRFVESPGFQLRDGVALPVAERVFDHLKAASVLSVSRARAMGAPQAVSQVDAGLVSAHTYAALLGEVRAAEETAALDAQVLHMAAAPAAAKFSVAEAFARQRGTKKYDNKEKNDT